jgi:hypothetical protein
VPVTQQDLTTYLTQFTMDWPRPGHSNEAAKSKSKTVTYTDVTARLLADDDFQELKLGGLLWVPDLELTTAAAAAITPPLHSEDIALLASAVRVAAVEQRKNELQFAGIISLAGAAALIVIIRFFRSRQ